MKIRQQIILGYMTIVLLMCIVGYFSVYVSKKILIKTIGEYTVATAHTTLDKIDRVVQRRIEHIETYTKNLPFKELLEQSNEEFDRLDNVQEYISQKDKEWTSVPKKEITAFMQTLIDNKLSEELRQKIELKKFFKAQYDYDIFTEVFITNKYGANVAQSQKTTDYYQADEQWWQEAAKNGTYLTDVEYDESLDVNSIAICRRIDDENGKFIGVLKAVFNIKEINGILEETAAATEYKNEEFNLFTNNGERIYSTGECNSDLSKKQLSDFHSESEKVNYFIAASDTTGKGRKLFTNVHSKGYKNYKGLGWVLLVEHDTKEIFEPIFWLINRLLAAMAIIAALTIVISFLISKHITSPIEKLCTATSCIGQGHLDTKIEIKSNDEIGQLAISFNNMIDNLKKTTTSLDVLNREITERKLAEKEFETIFDNAGDGILIADSESKKFHIGNNVICRMLGYSLEEIKNLGVMDIHPEKDIPYVADQFERQLKKEFSLSTNLPLKRKDGSVFYADVNATPLKMAGKKYLMGFFRDTTERKLAEETQKRLVTIIEATPDFVGFADAKDKHLIYVNKAGRKMCGIGNDEDVTKLKISDVHPEWTNKMFAEEILPSAVRDGVWTGECAFLNIRDRHEIPVLMVLSSHKASNGKVEVFSTISHDITERKRAEEEIKNLAKFPEENSNPVYRTSKDGVLLYANPAGRRLILEDQTKIGDKIPEKWFGMIKSAYDSGKTLQTEMKLSGRVFLFELVPIIEGGYVNSYAIDITEQKKAEEVMETINEDLKATVDKLALTNQELQELALITAHDLKAPLSGIVKLAEWISTKKENKFYKGGREQMNLLLARAKRMYNMLDGILQYYRIGKTKVKPAQVNLNQLVSEAINIIAPPKNMMIVIENELPVIECEEKDIKQVFKNLISNAVKHMDKPEGIIRISCLAEDACWKFSVADNGPGIEEKYFERIFRMFQTLQSRDKFESSGVGLAVVKKIVELYNGKIWVESTPGYGSTFFFTLPKHKVRAKNAKPKAGISC